LHAEAEADAAELGMRLPQPTVRRGRPTPPAVCTRRGRHWRIELRGRSAVVDDMVGMHHLATLVANPGVDITAVELAGPEPTSVATADRASQPVLDGQALRQYRTRLGALADEVAGAEAAGDEARVAALRSEADWLLHEVQAGTGPGGRQRQFTDSSERARIAVGKAIRRALDRVTAADAVIGEELRACVETGTRCCYRPAALAPRG
jgi:hypothetical protein